MSSPVFGYESDSEDELPASWEERTTFDGRVYYANHTDQTTQWTHPRTGKKKRLVGELPIGWTRKVLEDGKVVFCNAAEGNETYTDPRLAFAVEEKDEGPPRQRFDASSTALQVLHGIDLSNRTVLLTGATAGIGYETARALALHGAHIIIACRNVELGEEVRRKLLQLKPSAKIDILQCDFASLKSVRDCATAYRVNKWPLHLLILNAGVFALPYSRTADGFETTFQVNHLAQFYLTRLLTDVLVSSAPSRVVVVSSESHRFATNLSADSLSELTLSPSSASNYWYMQQYNVSKLCNVLFAFELDRRLFAKGVRCNAVHPGNMMATSLTRSSWLLWFAFQFVRPFTKTMEQGAATTVFAAVAPEMEEVGGQYFNNCWFCEPSDQSQRPELQQRLWTLSEELLRLPK